MVYCRFEQLQKVRCSRLLPANKIDYLVKSMCLAWVVDKFENPNLAESSYQKQVVQAVANGADELAAIRAWMQQVAKAKTGVT
ncbi:hypothetical protein A6770_32145 [Nostoc minutum NIES-26]|uniref:Uncharacterized protein n=1 Tax=Nostoc minutum NIES-26 TaxID=1844469 RepID=A0A367Q564_9NOSO|nr:hypothetical protein A6770_32145 [Nostoc minutum NIES-26]